MPASTEAAVINTAPYKAQAIAFINDAEAKMAELSIESNRADVDLQQLYYRWYRGSVCRRVGWKGSAQRR